MWLEHPKYVPARERLIKYLRSDRYRFRRLAPVIFLCGGAASPRRDALRDYLAKHRPRVSVFYAERVWEQIASSSASGALKMESDLAALADMVIIVVESPGTFAELGAFSLADPLRKKLLPIVDTKYQKEESFIATGPLRWIDQESDYKPTIYAPLSHVLQAIDEVEERIDRIPAGKTTRISDLASSAKHLLFFICDLIGVVHPVRMEAVQHYIARLVPSPLVDVPMLLGLGLAMGLLRNQTILVDGVPQVYIMPAKAHRTEHPYHHKRYLDLPSQRADHLSVLMCIPQARHVLESLRGNHDH